jgi:hypothetical protein
MADQQLARYNLNEFQTQILLPLEARGAGVITRELLIEGNSLLSSVFIAAADPGASVEVKYFDYTTGAITAERFDLESHRVLTTADVGDTNRITVARIHNKPVVEATVVGGSVTFGVYATVVSSFVTDLDQALQLDGATADVLVDKGMPFMCYDEDQNKFFFVRCVDGTIPVSESEAGDPVFEDAQSVTTPGIEQTLISTTVPALKLRKLKKVIVTCRQPGKYKIDDGSVIIGSGRTGAANLDSEFKWEPRRDITAGTTLNVKFTADSASPASDVEAYLMASDLDV